VGSPPTSPHFIGLVIALVGMAGVGFWATRARTAARLGRRRWWVVGAAAVLLLNVGLWGNGVYGMAARGTLGDVKGIAAGDFARRAHAASKALETALSDRFLYYLSELRGEVQYCEGAYLRQRVQLQHLAYRDLAAYGITISPPPPPQRRYVLYEYYDAVNYGLHLLGVGGEERMACFVLVQRMRSYFDELVLLELFRSAPDDRDRIAVLEAFVQAAPICAEWILREFEKFRGDSPSPAVSDGLDRATVHVTRYVDNPSLRGLPATTAVNLD
jgi:hypothetical protein